ncbi:MAG: hypothetical protein AB8G77_23440 [Rhodothermales bacterium]
MNVTALLDGFSLLPIFLVMVFSIILSIEFGFYLGKRQRKRAPDGAKIETGAVVAASLGLLAFMLAFTFGAVTSNYSERKQLLLDEVNAVGTLFLRADLLPASERDRVKGILSNYVNLRIDGAQAIQRDGNLQEGEFQHRVKQLITRSEEIQAELWSIAVAAADQNPTPINALFVQALNEVIDLHEKRITVALFHRMPSIFWITLFGLTILAMTVSGYNSGVSGGRRSLTATLGVTLAFTTVLLLIVALERPGQIIVSQDVLIKLQQTFNKAMQSQ